MTQSIYRKLQERLDLYSMGFPVAASGIEIKILKYLFTEKEAALFLALSPALETPEAISERIREPLQEMADKLDEMADKGLLFRLKKGDVVKYGAIPFVHGLFEFQVKSLKPDFAKMVGDYFEEAFDQAMIKNAAHFLRIIPVNKSIDLTHHVANYEDAVQILKSKKTVSSLQIVFAEKEPKSSTRGAANSWKPVLCLGPWANTTLINIWEEKFRLMRPLRCSKNAGKTDWSPSRQHHRIPPGCAIAAVIAAVYWLP